MANNMSDEKTELALEFIKYMTSAEVQEKIFTGVQANPCNTTVDLNALAEESDDAATRKLAQACSQVNEADTVVIDMNYTWGSDVDKAIINALMECAVSGTDIDAIMPPVSRFGGGNRAEKKKQVIILRLKLN